jgi:hypothetical protein
MKALRIISAVLLIYILTYAVLSLCGRYQPISVGIDHVEAYSWAPFGFYDADHAWSGSVYAVQHPTAKTGGWSRFVTLTFYPLWELDTHFIHSSHDKAA